jgi:hypothetical protein
MRFSGPLVSTARVPIYEGEGGSIRCLSLTFVNRELA